ncbi:hypothetical protein JAAARDRAFT_52826 [Jaapia argillacea MUCL 33604]|uniref:Nucleoside transporter n=1 Tax=Jaapia argillacea MUCL 33604 TaxID=933084 RepID=A0A067QD57_9AGAM|nr:hypothetical protein JAAARDRAFT_52826 [Jaapia argillacea MUCL 33604]
MQSSSTDALYHAIPQAPVAANSAPANTSQDSVIELEDGLVDDIGLETLAVQSDAAVRWIHFILGAATLLPWNGLITATPYFLSRLAGSSLARSFSSYLSCTFTVTNFVLLAHATATSKQASRSTRILRSITLLGLATLALTLSTFTHPSPGVFFAFVLICAIVQAGSGSYLQISIVAVASLFGRRAMQATMSGQAAVGVAVSLVQLISAVASVHTSSNIVAAAEEQDVAEEKAAFAFFALSTIFLVVAAGAQIYLMRLPAYHAVVGSAREMQKDVDEGDSTGGPHERQGLMSDEQPTGFSEDKHNIFRVFKANIVYEIAVAYVFVVTLAVFPPITVAVQPTNPATHPLLFTSIHFLLFNVGDFAGRYLCSFPSLLIWSSKRILTLSLARTAFIPLFLMCNFQRPGSTPAATPIINSDILFFIILLLFGLSNGYVCSMSMISAPSLEHNPQLNGRREDVDVAATLGSFCLVGGLMLGSIASFAVRSAMCGGCNPFTG